MNRRTFIKTITTTTIALITPNIVAKQKEYQWINVDIQRPPLNKEIAILKYTYSEDVISATIWIGEVTRAPNKSFVEIIPTAEYACNYHNSTQWIETPSHRIESNITINKRADALIRKYYITGKCEQDSPFFWLRKGSKIRSKDGRIGFHLSNWTDTKSYWTYVDEIPVALPKHNV